MQARHHLDRADRFANIGYGSAFRLNPSDPTSRWAPCPAPLIGTAQQRAIAATAPPSQQRPARHYPRLRLRTPLGAGPTGLSPASSLRRPAHTTSRSASTPHRVRLLLFHVNAADRARVVYMPDTAWPISGLPPDSSRNLFHAPVLMSPVEVSTRQQRFACARLPDPHLTPHTAPFPHRSPRRSSANAA